MRKQKNIPEGNTRLLQFQVGYHDITKSELGILTEEVIHSPVPVELYKLMINEQ